MTMDGHIAAKIIARPLRLRVQHYLGMPGEFNNGTDNRVELPAPAYLVIENDDGGCLLYRLTSEAKILTDTWHQTIDDAKAQASYEFENLLSSWVLIPEGFDRKNLAELFE